LIKINAKELVLKQLERQKHYNKLTKEEKISEIIESMKFNLKMYNKHKKANNNRYDKKCLNFNQWTCIMNIESIKKRF
jgi:hypothetical protein